MTNTSSKMSWTLTFFTLYTLTIAAQLANVAYQAIQKNESFASLLLPSLIFLSVLTIPSIYVGLKLGKQMDLGLVNIPENSTNSLKDGVYFALISSILLGITLLALRWLLLPYLPANIPEYGFRGPIGGLLVSIGAAFGEEIWFRFGLMTLLLWGLTNLLNQTKPSLKIGVSVIFIVAVGFGIAHLPQLASFDADSPFAIWATILGNIATGSLFGWCFWRYGLVSAISAHLGVDIVLHVLPAFFTT